MNKIINIFSRNIAPNATLTSTKGKDSLSLNNELNKYSLNKRLELYLKAFNLYNKNFSKYINNHNNLDLILQIKKEEGQGGSSLPTDPKLGGVGQVELEKLNQKISNYFYALNKIILKLKINSLIYNINLFIPREIVSTYSNLKYLIYSNDIYKNIINAYLIPSSSNSSFVNGPKVLPALPPKARMEGETLLADIDSFNLLIEKGREILNELDYQISLNKNIITKIKSRKVNGLVDSYLLESSSLSSSALSFKAPTVEGGGGAPLQVANIPSATNKGDVQPLTLLFKQNLAYNKLLKTINKSNEMKIEQTIKTISKNGDFDYRSATSLASLLRH